MEKEDPPTHLIRSTEGDYLRGRLIEMDDKTLTVEVRLETRRVPRDQVASIIWLQKPAQGAGSREQGARTPAPDSPPGHLRSGSAPCAPPACSRSVATVFA